MGYRYCSLLFLGGMLALFGFSLPGYGSFILCFSFQLLYGMLFLHSYALSVVRDSVGWSQYWDAIGCSFFFFLPHKLRSCLNHMVLLPLLQRSWIVPPSYMQMIGECFM